MTRSQKVNGAGELLSSSGPAPSERMAMTWGLVLEWAAQHGLSAEDLKLQRSVVNILRGRSQDSE